MNAEKITECEKKRIGKLMNFRLSSKFMSVGLAIGGISIVLMFVRAFAMDGDTEWLKLLLQKTVLVGLLIMSISKDKEEDEMIVALRSQSYAIAFVIGVVYSLVMPYVEFGVDSVVESNVSEFKNLGDFQVLLFMLMIQLLFFHNLKRYR
jgi:hypothetical protein